MGVIKARGVVIKQWEYGEKQRMLSILTQEYGVIKAAGGAQRKGARSASGQFLCYADFELYQGRSEVLSINGIDIIESFYPIQEDIVRLSLCSYFSDCIYQLLGAQNPDEDVLRLYLNMLYALAYRNEDTRKIKVAFELKLMALGGYEPYLDGCMVCGAPGVFFEAAKGGLVCRQCAGGQYQNISPAELRLMRYLLNCPEKRLLAFTAPESLLTAAERITERYLRVCLDMEQELVSLSYYKNMYALLKQQKTSNTE